MTRRTTYRYCVYGITVTSAVRLALPKHADGHLGNVDFSMAPARRFASAIRGVPFNEASDEWFQYAALPDGSSYVRTRGVGEFLVSSDGLRIEARQFAEASRESFQVYLLGRAISFALVKQGFEPLHATVVLVDGQAAAFLGESGFGKSSLAACFLQAGYRILTDDLLLLRESGSGWMAYPGPPRIKLLPQMARRFLGQTASGVPMNPDTSKLILPLGSHQDSAMAAPLAAIYALTGPRGVPRNQKIEMEPLSPRDSFLALVRNTFNYRVVNPARLERQFVTGTRLAASMPLQTLKYPRVLKALPEVRDLVIADLKSRNREAAA